MNDQISTTYRDLIERSVVENAALLAETSDAVWGHAEIRYEEERSSALLAGRLEAAGFTVTRNAGGIATAFVASYGSGAPVIALLGEYDALSNLSQVAGAACRSAVVEGGNGHGCGHNLLGVGALGAALAAKACKDALKLPGTLRFYGCPAEEGGGGKAFMARAGLFDDVDAAFTWHPWDENLAYHARMLATNQMYFTFTGKSSHAAFTPHLGRSALDAVELMNVGTNFLREHIIPEARVHYAITNAGGLAPNVVQSNAEVLYKIRAPQMGQVRDINARILDVARGAALMTSTSFEMTFDAASADLIPNAVLAGLLHDELTAFGPPRFTAAEEQAARQLQETFSPDERKRAARKTRPLAGDIEPFTGAVDFLNGSTDVGDVSWLVPTGQVYIATCALGTPPHSWQMVTQGTSSHAHRGMAQASKILAGAVVRALTDPDLVARAKAEHRKELGGERYVSLIPAEAKPLRLRR
jgi:aminobenzoyl-glutamate utilization protein B